MDNLDSITDPIEEVLQRQLTRTKETNKNFHEQWMYLHNTHEDIVGEVERVYGV